MCGATQQQNDLESQQAAFYAQGTQQAQTTFAEDQALLAQIKSVYDPILAKGPNQMGFSDEELANLRSQEVQGTAENFRNASKTLNEQLAAEGGDNPDMTGTEKQLQGELLGSAASEKSKEELGIVQSGYQQGYNEFEQATQAELGVSGQYNPTAFENAATNSGSAAATTADQIAQEQNSWINAAIGAAGEIGAGLATH